MVQQKQAPTQDDFLQWRDNPVTQWVMQALQLGSEAQKAEWMRRSWGSKQADPLVLCELTTRADAYRVLFEADYIDWCETNGDEPRKDA